ncbi:MAG: beta-eliminating lyase-related protein [Marinilabiliales bacterium]|nr:beta-eliminating lyase-related protein [Marinilabiliales bacterium]
MLPTRSWNSVICAETAHINEDECGAPEKFNGFKLLSVETHNGKLTVESIQKHMKGFDFEHHSQPKVISITQATELGTVYTIDEIKSLADFAHTNNMYLHMDGARIANAAVTLNKSFKEFTKDAGVDILSFGGTKNGMMYGEAYYS